MDKLLERNRSVYAAAVAARDNAKNLSSQADDATAERERLRVIAEEKMAVAQQAAQAAQEALAPSRPTR